MLTKSNNQQLVFVKDAKVVTDSLTIASAFEKGHDKVLRDIRNLKCSPNFHSSNFGESSYENKQSRLMPMFIVTQDGFALLCMGYNGEKAMQFKERYINEFNRTRQILESQQITLLAAEQKQIQQAVSNKIRSLFSQVSDKARRKYFSKLYSELKSEFHVSSFRDIQRSDYEKALKFIQHWHSPNLARRRLERIKHERKLFTQ